MNQLLNIMITMTLLSCNTNSRIDPLDDELTGIRTSMANGVRTKVYAPEVRSTVPYEGAKQALPAQLTFIVERDRAPRRESRPAMNDHGTIQEYNSQQAGALNAWKGHVKLVCGDSTYRPVLSHVEQTHGLTQSGKVILVFAPASLNDTVFGMTPVLDLVLDDRGAATGIQHYRFKQAELRHI